VKPVDRRLDTDGYAESATVLGSDLTSATEVSVQGVATLPTTEQRTAPTIIPRGVTTARAGLARVSGIDTGHRATSGRCLLGANCGAVLDLALATTTQTDEVRQSICFL